MPSPADILRSKQLLPTDLRTREWDAATANAPATAAWVKERAFFMAGVAQAQRLQEFRNAAAQVADGTMSPQEARRHVRRTLQEAGYTPETGLQGTIKDLSSTGRLKVSIETNVALARGWAQHATSMANTARPGQELYRAGASRQPRDWETRWKEAAAGLPDAVQDAAPMVALKTSPVWERLSRFGNPYPPFDFNSRMRVRSVSLDRCRQLGLLPRDDDDAAADQAARQRTMLPSLNENVCAPMKDLSPELRAQAENLFQGIAEWDAPTQSFRMTDMNGTRPYDWQDIGRIISAPNPAIGNLQLEAAQAWMENSNVYAPDSADVDVQRAPLDMKEDFIRLMNRIIPTAKSGPGDRGQDTIMRGLGMDSAAARQQFLKRVRKEGYGARQGYVAESWTNSAPAARGYADSAAPVVLVCDTYRSRRRFDGLYRELQTGKQDAKHPHQLEGESLMPGSVRFKFKGQELKNGVLYIYVEEA